MEKILNNDETNKERGVQEIGKNILLYPNERIVAFLARNYKNINENYNRRALDVGLGSGRHLKLLLDYGFETYGVDYSEESLEVAKRTLGQNNLLKDLDLGDFKEIGYEEDYFDVLMVWGVIFYRRASEILEDLKYINKIMKQDGKMIINFRTKEDYLYGKGTQVDENAYILDASVGPYSDVLYTFLDCDEASRLLNEAGFIVENIERDDYWKNNLKEHHSWWIFTVRKG